MQTPPLDSPSSLMGAKPAPAQRLREPNSENNGRSSFQQKLFRFSFFSTPPSVVSKADATPRSPESKPENSYSSSIQQKDVCLFEWWLIKTEKVYDGRRLAVGGFTKRGEAMGSFTSAPIIKRHDDCTVETADGITLRLQGPINKTRTFDNGFPLEVSATFLFGFPVSWDSYTAESSEDMPSHQPIMGQQQETVFEPSSQKKTVCLRNWWLRKTEKVDGSRLAVGGFSEFGKAMRIFNSSPIIKRHDVYTLETSDGITVRIQGFINKTRTLDNGFPLEACKTFLIGFPTTWTDVLNNSFVGEPSHNETPVNASPSTGLYKDFLKNVNFYSPVRSENVNLKNAPSISNTSICKSSTILMEVIPELEARESMSNSVHMPLTENFSHNSSEKKLCDNDRLQVDKSCGTSMRFAETADKDYEFHDVDRTTHNIFMEGVHTMSTGCQTSGADRLPQEKTVDDGKLDIIHEATSKNSDKCCGHALTKGPRNQVVDICRTSVSLDFGNVQGDFQSYSRFLNNANNLDCAKFAPNGSETSATRQPIETLVERSPSSSNIYGEEKFGESSTKTVRNSERAGLQTLANVHIKSQDCSQFLDDTNNVNCSNSTLGGSKPLATVQPNGILVEGNPSLPNLYEENQKFIESSAKPVRRSERLALARLGNLHVESHNNSQSLDVNHGINCATSASKPSATSSPNCATLTGSLSSSTKIIPLPSAKLLIGEDQNQHSSLNGSTLKACLWQSLNERGTSSCDRVVGQVEETPLNSKASTSTLGKNMMKSDRQRNENQTVRSRSRVEQNDCILEQYFTTTKENLSISPASNSRRKIKSVRASTSMEKPKCKVSHTNRHKTIWVSNYTDVHTPRNNQCKVRNLSILTPDSLCLKRSRSGRLLIPKLDCFTRIVYEADGSIAGTANVDGSVVTSTVAMSSSKCKGTGATPR